MLGDRVLSKTAAKILGSRLSEHRVLDTEPKIFHCNKDEELVRCF